MQVSAELLHKPVGGSRTFGAITSGGANDSDAILLQGGPALVQQTPYATFDIATYATIPSAIGLAPFPTLVPPNF